MDANELPIVVKSLPNTSETFTDEDIRNAIEVMEMLYRWKKELENSNECDKEVA